MIERSEIYGNYYIIYPPPQKKMDSNVKVVSAVLFIIILLLFYYLGMRYKKVTWHSMPERAAVVNHIQMMRDLMPCQPVLKKVPVKSLLKVNDPLIDELLIPDIVGVRLCRASCSYCGNDFGMETKKCEAESITLRNFTVQYYNKGGKPQYINIPIQEHLTCKCSSVSDKIN